MNAADPNKSKRLLRVGQYSVSECGQVWSHVSGRWLKQRRQNAGYLFVSLYNDGNRSFKNTLVHRLVAQAFVPNPEMLRCVNHKDGNKDNNAAANLEWVSHSQNMKHAAALGLWAPPAGSAERAKRLGQSRRKVPFETVQQVRALWRTGGFLQKELAVKFGIDFRLVSEMVRDKTYMEAA